MIEPGRINGRKVNAETMALGKAWRHMMVRSFTPKARAARIYSKFLTRRNSARTTPTRLIQLKMNSTASKLQKLGTMMLATMIKINSVGNPDQISMKR